MSGSIYSAVLRFTWLPKNKKDEDVGQKITEDRATVLVSEGEPGLRSHLACVKLIAYYKELGSKTPYVFNDVEYKCETVQIISIEETYRVDIV